MRSIAAFHPVFAVLTQAALLLVAVRAGALRVGAGVGIAAGLAGGILAVGGFLLLAGGILGVGALLVHRLVVHVFVSFFALIMFCAPYSEHVPSMGGTPFVYTVAIGCQKNFFKAVLLKG